MANKSILIIEDDQEIRLLLADFLKEYNFNTKFLDSGLKVYDAIKEFVPDLIIIDLLLPGEHGIDIIQKVKKEYFIPVIIMSGIYKKKELSNTIENHFVEDFFEKPFDLDRLLSRINSILDG